MKIEPLFWLVWREDGGSPTCKHETFADARKEAQRLARQHPEGRFIVLMPTLSVRKNDILESKFGSKGRASDLDEDIPF